MSEIDTRIPHHIEALVAGAEICREATREEAFGVWHRNIRQHGHGSCQLRIGLFLRDAEDYFFENVNQSRDAR